MIKCSISSRVAILGAAIVTTCLLGIPAAKAQYPTKPIHLVVTVAPGGFLDIATRKIGEELKKKLGQPIVVENKPGAGGLIATDYVARSQPDGYTLLLTTSTISLSDVLYKNVPYNMSTDFAAIGAAATFPLLVISNPQTGVKSLPDFIALAKQKPGQLSYAAPGKNVAMLNFELLKEKAGIDMTFIPYQGGAAQVTAVMRNDVQVYMDIPMSQRELIAAGKLVPLAVTSRERLPEMPEIPTVAESGFPDYVAEFWVGILGPSKLPPDVLTKLRGALDAVRREPSLIEWLRAQGYSPTTMSADELASKIQGEIKLYRQIAATAKISPE